VTFLTWIDYTPIKRGNLLAPRTFACSQVSVIVPVKNNQAGVDRFLAALFHTHAPDTLPREIIIVDNRSAVPIVIPQRFAERAVPIRLVRCDRQGPASARNAGCAVARGKWLLFTDSDCEPTRSFVSGYAAAMNGSVGYAGYVRSRGTDRFSRYYESQDILIPPRVAEDRPHYLITANSLVWRHAFEVVGGFDEGFPLAGGEDVDLGFRLSQSGSLSYAPASVVEHDFGDGARGFIRRFVRYGWGNQRLARRYRIDLRPRPIVPAHRSLFNWGAAMAQFLCLSWGYWTAARDGGTLLPTREARSGEATRLHPSRSNDRAHCRPVSDGSYIRRPRS
jgi:glycosyltransferase involved in cell wall biosynthesis